MSLWQFFTRKSSSAPVARDRLQILLAHERGSGGLAGQSDLVAKLQEEILAVIARHVAVDRDKVLIKLDRGAQVSTLEIDIEVPDLIKAAKAAPDNAKAKAAPDNAEAKAAPDNAAAGTEAAKTAKPALRAG